MTLSMLLLALYLILTGLGLLGIVSISSTVLGLIALVAGILFLVEAVHPITIYKRQA